VDSARLDASWAGRFLDRRFLEELPPTVDPCGENGEYHTFVFDGPGFSHPVALAHGETVSRDPFCFRDLASVGSPADVVAP
jgi:diphthamide synthase (EF-2-diphthine--ammonia ligase)